MQHLVSIIIPNYNHAHYLDERIQSVLNQTYQYFEVIILDDKSTDNSREVIEKYRDHPKVSHIVFNEENSGSTFKQWDKGFGLAKGDLIWIAESDDSCDSHLLEKLISKFEQDKNLVLAFCKSLMIDENGKKADYDLQQIFHEDFKYSGDVFIKKYLRNLNYIANASSALFSKSAALSVDPCYKTMRGEGDYVFWIELLETGNMAYINAPFNYFRHHSSNTTSKLVSSGLSIVENKQTFDLLVSHHYFNRRDRFKARYKKVIYFYNSTKDNKFVQKKAMKVWDRFHIYRITFKLSSFFHYYFK